MPSVKFSKAVVARIIAAEHTALVNCISEIHKIWDWALAPLLEGRPAKLSERQLYPAILDFAAARFDLEAQALLKSELYSISDISLINLTGLQFGLIAAQYVVALIPHHSRVADRQMDEAQFDVPDRETAEQWIKDTQDRLSGGVDYEREAKEWFRSFFPHYPSLSADEIVYHALHSFAHPLYDDVQSVLEKIVERIKIDRRHKLSKALLRRLSLREAFWMAEATTDFANRVASGPDANEQFEVDDQEFQQLDCLVSALER